MGWGARASLSAPGWMQGPTYSIKLPETNSLHFSVPVADIKAIVTGKDCPHMKEKSALKQNKVSGEAALSPSCCSSDPGRSQWWLLSGCMASHSLSL